jgi:NADH:ubiquinone oxidoreductase subunit 6 (subunit J)
MTSSISAVSSAHLKTEVATRPCWPIIWLWIFSIAQYSYRYILQVNDDTTSHAYASTPRPLSAIKYAIFFLFALYAVFSPLRRSVSIDHRYSVLSFITSAAIIVLAAIFVVRLALYPGALDETVICGLQLIPWVASVFFVPLVFKEKHSPGCTLITFERIIFWIAFPFWIMTVTLAGLGIRYPALSYPGLLVRFGGILDDPNGYACLCLLLAVLAITFREGSWRWRAIAYGVMLLGTLSVAGYLAAIMVVVLCLFRSLFGSPQIFRSPLASLSIISAVLIAAIAILFIGWEPNDNVVDSITSLYSAKSNSTISHLSDLLPEEAMLDASSPVALLCGVGGFSENFYWRILANFGWLGLFAVIGTVSSWTFCALVPARKWRYNIGAWNIGVLLGSNGIAYLLTFPLNLIYWSLLGLLVWTRESDRSVERGRELA